jgi:hypothetical protein
VAAEPVAVIEEVTPAKAPAAEESVAEGENNENTIIAETADEK